MGTGPDFSALLDELAQLKSELERLYLANVSGFVETERKYTQSRSPVPRKPVYSPWRNLDRTSWFGGSNGLEVSEIRPSADESATAEVFYNPVDGLPWVNGVGQSLVKEPGWCDCHHWEFTGEHSPKAIECLKRLNAFVWHYRHELLPMLFAPRRVNIREVGYWWPSVVHRVSEIANRSALLPPRWFVPVNGGAMGLDVWLRRDEFTLGTPIYSQSDLEKLGDVPEILFCRRTTFLRDSELALEWIASRLKKIENGYSATETRAEANSESGGDVKQQQEINQLEQETPHLDTESIAWIRVREIVGEKSEGVNTGTLAKYRLESEGGVQTQDKMLGKDKDGRVWRRIGTPSSHPWYLRKTLLEKLRETPKP